MKSITIVRFAYLPEATLNYWFIDGRRLFCGLGEPWRADPDGPGGQARQAALQESCIPDGEYSLRPHVSPKYPSDNHVWFFENEKLGVWAPRRRPLTLPYGRDAVLVHNGTTTDNILGCELIGKRHGTFPGSDGPHMPAVFDSMVALRELRAILGSKETHAVVIRPTRGTNEVLP